MSRTSRTHKLVAAGAIAALALTGAACSDDDDGDEVSARDTATTTAAVTDTAAPAEGVVVDDPWIRESPMVTGAAAGYATLTSPVDDELLSVTVDPSVAATVELHETVMADTPTTERDMDRDMDAEGDMDPDRDMETDRDMGEDGDMPAGAMQMRPVESIELPAGEPVELAPGGLHIMILELAAQLEEGQEVELTLVFAEAGEQVVTFEVRSS